jgi:hypothetical protein
MKKLVLVILIITIFTTSGFAYFMTCNKYLELFLFKGAFLFSALGAF